jgi:hypothetical protein
MGIKDKIKYIEQTGFGFYFSSYYDDYSVGAVAFTSRLFEKGLIDEQETTKLKLVANKTNFYRNYWYKDSLNSQSILFINLVYKILNKE